MAEPILVGRDAETWGLFNLICSSRIAVLHSPPGAGASTLVRYGLMPRLVAARFEIEGPIGIDPEDLSAAMPRLDGQMAGPTICIFDHFERVLAAEPEAIERFFSDLARVLHDPRVFALFMVREEFLGALDPWRELLPTQLNHRFRLGYFTPAVATEVILASWPSTREAAELIVERLLEVSPLIETPLLNIVCTGLSEDAGGTIGVTLVESVEDFNFLIGYWFAARIARIAIECQLEEVDLRRWVIRELLGPQAPALLEDDVLEALEREGLVSWVPVGGVLQLTIAYESLVPAIFEEYEAWLGTQPPLQRAAWRWDDNERRERFLLPAREFARLKADTPLDPVGVEFVEACRNAKTARIVAASAARRADRLNAGMVVLFGMAAAAALWSYAWMAWFTTYGKQAYFATVLVANLVGALPAIFLLRLYRRDQRWNDLMARLDRKLDLDDSIQYLGREVTFASSEPPSDPTSRIVDSWEASTIDFVPLWIFLIVIGSSGRTTRADLARLEDFTGNLDGGLLDEFLADPRSAVTGLFDATEIVFAKSKPKEVEAFHKKMMGFAHSLRPDQPKLETFPFLSAILSGKKFPENAMIHTDRPVYRPTISSLPGLFVAASFTGFFACLLGWPIAGYGLYAALPAGLLLGWANHVAAGYWNVRIRVALVLLALSTAIVFTLAAGGSWLVFGLVLLPMVVAAWRAGNQVYCANCGTDATTREAMRIHEATVASIEEIVRTGNVFAFAEGRIPREEWASNEPHLAFHVASCDTCQDFHVLTVSASAQPGKPILPPRIINRTQAEWLLTENSDTIPEP